MLNLTPGEFIVSVIVIIAGWHLFVNKDSVWVKISKGNNPLAMLVLVGGLLFLGAKALGIAPNVAAFLNGESGLTEQTEDRPRWDRGLFN